MEELIKAATAAVELWELALRRSQDTARGAIILSGDMDLMANAFDRLGEVLGDIEEDGL